MRGIIPARAGFTSGRTPSAPRTWDHPRSRGVYARISLPTLVRGGSSPLARGLLLCISCFVRSSRIIPARAGFTHRWPARARSPQDHPRSRGVYTGVRFTNSESRGSSPLARGLHLPGGRGNVRRRIIPARAGFTGVMNPLILESQDHPRSRGVYGLPCDHLDALGGSSPLARGLRGGGT